jgi:endonuclease YncB( thermonuclease family)
MGPALFRRLTVSYSHYGKIRVMRIFVLMLCLTALPALAFAKAPLSGMAHVHDGDTIRIGSQSIRLWGIDAVELSQSCGSIACGKISRDALIAIIGGRAVTCIPKGKSYNRVVATCTVGGADIAALMARAGMAFDYAHYSHGHYKTAEDAAKSAHIGLWAMDKVDVPAHWRACHLPARKGRRPTDCAS